MNHARNGRPFIWITILLGLCLLPGLVLSSHKFVDAFIWIPVAESQDALEGQTVGGEQAAHPIGLAVLAQTTGIQIPDLVTVPIGTVLVPLSFFLTSWVLSRSYSISLLVGLIAAWDFSIVGSHYNTFMYAWTTPLFLTFVVATSLLWGRGEFRRATICIIVIYMAIFLMHPAVTMWAWLMVTLSLFVVPSVALKKPLRKSLDLSIALLAITIFFNRFFYEDFIPSAFFSETGSQYFGLSDLLLSLVGLAVPASQAFTVPPIPLTPLVGSTILLRTALVFLLSGMAILIGWDFLRRAREAQTRMRIAFALVFFAIGIAHTATYLLRGHPSFRFATLFFPMAVLTILHLARPGRVKWRNMAPIVGIGILVVCMVGMASVVVVLEDRSELETWDWREVMPATSFALDNLQGEVITDFETALFMQFRNTSFQVGLHDPNTYYSLLGEYIQDESSSIIVYESLWGRPMPTRGWTFMSPLEGFEEEIDSNPDLFQFYENGRHSMFRLEGSR